MNNQSYRSNSKKITVAALLTAFGILIPIMMPFKLIIGPASYTLGSHIPINIAMFSSTGVGIVSWFPDCDYIVCFILCSIYCGW